MKLPNSVLILAAVTVLSLTALLREKRSVEEYATNLEHDHIFADEMHVFETNRTGLGLRGKHWLKENLNLVLTMDRPNVKGAGDYELLIHPISKEMSCNASKLEIWVRIGGPEIFAGSAIPDANDCSWTFPFKMARVGEYIVEAKVLLYNGRADVHPRQCNITEGNIASTGFQTGAVHEGFKGSKLYSPHTACCEVCTRVAGCIAWTYPNKEKREGCELFYADESKSSSVVRLLSSIGTNDEKRRRLLRMAPAFGTPRGEETAYYLGCGWSFWLSADYPCEDPATDDMVANFTITYHGDDHNVTNHDSDGNDGNSRPICTIADEMVEGSRGRWVRQPYPNKTQCPNEKVLKGLFKESVIKFDADHPRCWYRDNLANHGKICIESGCALWIGSAWQSWLHKETHFHGTWEPYGCQYRELTNVQLQKCITAKKIANISADGASIKTIVQDYLSIRLAGIQFMNRTVKDRVFVSVDTLKFPHLLWHNSQEGWATELRKLDKANATQLKYWMSSLYVTSEREEFVHQGRAKLWNEIAEPILKKKGWKELSMYDVSAAFMYDTTGQMDGLHLIGPPMKVLVTKLLSHLCYDVDLS